VIQENLGVKIFKSFIRTSLLWIQMSNVETRPRFSVIPQSASRLPSLPSHQTSNLTASAAFFLPFPRPFSEIKHQTSNIKHLAAAPLNVFSSKKFRLNRSRASAFGIATLSAYEKTVTLIGAKLRFRQLS
jgi:hypothetical protein